MTVPPPSPSPQSRHRLQPLILPALALLLIAAHVALTFYFDPPTLLFGSQPVSGSDYDTHIEQAWRVLEGLTYWGKSWVYDVHLLAGHPNGVIFDADNKGWEWLTYALVRAGLPRSIAFNTFLLLAHLLVLPVMFAAARLFGMSRSSALLSAALGSALWFFDSYMHWIWWVGTLAFAFASYFYLLPLALFYRFCQERRARHALLCALTMGIAHWIHPYTFFVLALPMAIMYLQKRRELTLPQHAWVLGIASFVVLFNLPWLVPSVQQWHYVLDSGYFGRGDVAQLLADFAGVLRDTATTGIIFTHTGLRFACFGAAAIGLTGYAKRNDPRFAPITSALVFFLLLSYLGAYSHVAAQVQPYRFIGAAAFLAALVAADACSPAAVRAGFAALSGPGRALLWLLVLLLGKHFVTEAIAYFPSSLPAVPALLDGVPSPVTPTGYPNFVAYRHIPDQPFLREVSSWVDAHDDGRGRFLVQVGAVGEQLAWKTDAEIIGGFVLRNLEHARANLFRRRLEHALTREQVRAYLEAYAIEWVVLNFPDPWFDSMPELFERHAEVTGTIVLKTKVPISRFEQGSGEIFASTNRIAVMYTNPAQDIVLRYHFHEMLECGPHCRVEPHANPVGGVPFIRVPAPHPASFAISNSYRVAR
ncbi:MAG TPA: hypothetical protein VF331_23620 [Polyangiales bacterium]